MKYKLFTDFDLDGTGCSVLAKYIWNDVDIQVCENHDPNPYLEQFIKLKEYENYDKIYMTDVSPNEKNAEKIDKLFGKKFQLLDHHETALWLNKYEWSYVKYDKENPYLTCGTDLFYNNIVIPKYGDMCYDTVLNEFVDLVRKYDTWEWNKTGDTTPKQLNDIFMFYGRDKFITKILYRINGDSPIFDEHDYDILAVQQKKFNEYLEEQKQNIVIKNFFGYKIGCVFSERNEFVSLLGNKLSELNPDCDFIVIINTSGTVNLRTTKENINLGKIAKSLGGGGHLKAAGFNFNPNILEKIFTSVFIQE